VIDRLCLLVIGYDQFIIGWYSGLLITLKAEYFNQLNVTISGQIGSINGHSN